MGMRVEQSLRILFEIRRSANKDFITFIGPHVIVNGCFPSLSAVIAVNSYLSRSRVAVASPSSFGKPKSLRVKFVFQVTAT